MNASLLSLLLTIGFPSLPVEHASLNDQQQECFATSMIGYDYVINSRAGLPITKALNTVTVDESSSLVGETYKYYLKTVVTNAYQWQGSPHTYALKVMYDCAYVQGRSESGINAPF